MPIPPSRALGDTTHVQDHNNIASTLTSQASDIAAKASLASPAFTGTPTAPTATAGTNTTQLATTAFVSTAVANLVDAAPGTLDTLNELAAAINDDANFYNTVAPKSSPSFTGSITLDSKINIDTSTTTVNANTATTVHTLDKTIYRSAEFTVQVKQGSKYTVSKLAMLHDGTTANIAEYALIELGASRIPLTISITVSGNNILLQATITDAATTNATVEVVRTSIVV